MKMKDFFERTIYELNFIEKIRWWWEKRMNNKWLIHQFRTRGTTVPGKYKTIQEVIDADERFIIVAPKT